MAEIANTIGLSGHLVVTPAPTFNGRPVSVNRAAREAQRKRCYSVFNVALKRGDIAKPGCCSECGAVPDDFSLRLEAHHADHAAPLDVEWLCSQCHGGRNIEAYISTLYGPAEWTAIVAKAKRDGISLRALILGLLKDWLSR